MAEVIGILSAVLSAIAIYVTLSRNRQDLGYRDTKEEVDLEARLTALENQLNRMIPVNDRVVALETKIGVFWHMVEQMSVAQLVHTTEREREAAEVYDSLKDRAPTHVLRILDEYLSSRLVDEETPFDEKAIIILKLGAIKSQLIDRGEEPTFYGV